MAISHIDLSRTLILERYFSSIIFKAIPADKGDFRPEPKVRTVVEQLSHIGAYDEWLVQGLGNGIWAIDVFTDRPESTVEEALAYMDHNRKRLLTLIDELNDEGLVKPIGPNPVFSHEMGVSNVILTTLTHECHHRGQLVLYLRMMGITPPSFHDAV
jgi:uncharacterized damage-inducible protein DinB